MKFPRFKLVAQPSLAAGSSGFPARCLGIHVSQREQGCSGHPQAGKPPLRSQRGIALVVTLILLSVITFLTVAFLFLSSRERGAVTTSVDQTKARLASEAAVEQAKAEVLATIMASGNVFNYDLRVSTNFINPLGIQAGDSSLTNVSYYLPDGTLTPAGDPRFLTNMVHLFYHPRPPVFVRTNRDKTLPTEFRYFLDLNRNGRFDANGFLFEMSGNASLPYVDTNGNLTASTNAARKSFYVGDPEWEGILERSDRPHSGSNRFTGRFAYVVVPSGKALTVNTIHNQSKMNGAGQDGYSRNMGIGPWEMNLASFLVDLNTNTWQRNAGVFPYFYNTNMSPAISTGTSFEDALALTRFRYNGNWANLRSVSTLFGPAGVAAFRADGADGYGRGPLMVSNTLPVLDPDQSLNNTGFGWPGDDNTNHFFTTQDFFDPTKSSLGFVNRLRNAGNYSDSYNRYTYYRLLSQMGTESGPEAAGKLDVNYVNVNGAGKVVPDMQTNFVSWKALQFFTNAANRLLGATFPNSASNRAHFGVSKPLSITNIPVLVSNRFVYTPSLHRVFQLAANIYDASTNHTLARRGADFPSVFRPTFKRVTEGGFNNIYIDGFEEVGEVKSTSDSVFAKPLDLNNLTDRDANVTGQNIYGVPWVIGAKKGFPNFNEFAMQSVSEITRKIQLSRFTTNAPPNATNQMFIVGISNVFGFEAWNSYQASFSRPVDVIVANDMTLAFRYTNDVAHDSQRFGVIFKNLPLVASTNLSAWPGTGLQAANPSASSFLIPLQTNMMFLPESIYRMSDRSRPYFTNYSDRIGFEQTKAFPIPQFSFAVSNRILFIALAATDSGRKRVIDYVQLNDLNEVRNLTSELALSNESVIDDNDNSFGSESMFWQTNRVGGNTLAHPPQGIVNQIEVSLGNKQVADWNRYGRNNAIGDTKKQEIEAFRVFMRQSTATATSPNTNTVIQAPFTPTRVTSQNISWQANDPLVHYTAEDLAALSENNQPQRENPAGPLSKAGTLGALNNRYDPWGGGASSADGSSAGAKYELGIKDPGVKRSDHWSFTTNKYPTVGWLGRVHRGTPWQTIYLKSDTVNDKTWTNWTGNGWVADAQQSKPSMDRAVFDVFTTAFDENATRGQLNVNQTNLAAWSAVMAGVIGLSNNVDKAVLDATNRVFVGPVILEPAGLSAVQTNSPLWKIYDGINRTRAGQNKGVFNRLADILETPELTVESPLLNRSSDVQKERGLDDATYERLPQMLMGLLRGTDQPRFTIYAYGQTLKPADRPVMSSSFAGLVTNYQVTAEFATRTVVRIEGAPERPKVVVESFNVLGPDE